MAGCLGKRRAENTSRLLGAPAHDYVCVHASCATPSVSAQSEEEEPARLSNAEGATGRSQEPPESSLLRRGSSMTGSMSFEGLPVRDRLTLPQSLEDVLGLESSASLSMAGLLRSTAAVDTALPPCKVACQHADKLECMQKAECHRCRFPART